MSSNNNTFIAGTRGSVLAVSQTNMLLDMLKNQNPGVSFKVKTIKTSGDMGMREELGAWVKEVEIELRKDGIDLAVHSYKDMPTGLPSGLLVACTPKRGEHRDCLIARDGMKLTDLPSGARIGTSSLRRAYQLKKLRPDVEVVSIHGNIITRMNKVENGELDAVVLALAGLQRVNMGEKATQVFSTDEMLPAVSQGALAIEIRDGDERTYQMVTSIHDEDTEAAVAAERSFLTALGGGCRMPMAAFARIENNEVLIEGMYCTEDGSRMERSSKKGPAGQAAEIGMVLAQELLQRFK